MSYPYALTFKNQHFTHLSEDTRKLNAHTLLVQTPSNAPFVQAHLAKEPKTPTIQALELYGLLNLSLKIVGVTGTNGKTTTASCIYSLLLDLGHACALLGTRGFFISDRRVKEKGLTTPTLLELYMDLAQAQAEGVAYFVMEVSSHAIAQERILGLEFVARVHTNITSDHLDYHKDLETYRAVKNSFFQGEGLKIINRDDPVVRFNPTHAYGYGLEHKTHLSTDAYSLHPSLSAHLSFKPTPKAPAENSLLHSPLIGRHNLYNLLGAVLCVRLLTNKPLADICALVPNFLGVKGRLEVVRTSPLVVVDFAHTADGFTQIFNSFAGQKIKVVFGAGGDRDQSKRPLMGQVATKHALKTYITSDNPRSENPLDIIKDILEGIPESKRSSVVVEADRQSAIELALSELREDEILLILGKGDENMQIIGSTLHPFDDCQVVRAFYKDKT
ncbi:UDP-N-acetylmuramoyl-L-alanyl-D-glutamate--2,6-diaminopimelate ligase [Helicobacter ailurogastricus]|uniref:UDP-N-acetylmuramoyl-L-alanyl-D-glutamate--2, 6-diaminopimelate ligase n=1 Tax=Helicobacter ailurogastricus TaxID=1578720 RepID=UPI0022CAB334|nr:UDP-N-acetylmuramoyl-L-alanyl-D-glutamate--2,6-diaminopimelate ligase [Helicobacter ailurogastricus]GLH57607.1 UDP-N-acetylmuramoylalanyl-D-glutamate--2, 6-diaminopimelate ligase MurE [Helicobacter ailurogastricus]GLH59985.1 UDP-N-acetylmuramoylalanyl-D-glutamate--2, 6-diaminopimelate ligase MurE [Helicobacter ailurogastricus]